VSSDHDEYARKQPPIEEQMRERPLSKLASEIERYIRATPTNTGASDAKE
jgi:hypothetical protein